MNIKKTSTNKNIITNARVRIDEGSVRKGGLNKKPVTTKPSVTPHGQGKAIKK